jgi:kynurenine formamidase
MDRRRLLKLTSLAIVGSAASPAATALAATPSGHKGTGLWGVFDNAFARARYVSLSHVLTPDTPIWKGFPETTKFQQGTGRLDDKSPYAAFTYDKTGLETTAYTFATDQFGTQLDPPAHWHPCFPAIDELPPTLATDVFAWEKKHGKVPAGSVVMVRSDWSKRWPDKAKIQPADGKFPGVTLDALKLLHLERKILFHGHEPLDADSTPTLIAEDWLMANGYMQAEGVTNLDQVPEVGALVAIGFPRLKGGTGGFASFTAICPPEWKHGERIGDRPDAPLPYNEKGLVWNEAKGMRERTAACEKPKGKMSFN